jgi:hypothetical protein
MKRKKRVHFLLGAIIGGTEQKSCVVTEIMRSSTDADFSSSCEERPVCLYTRCVDCFNASATENGI